MHARAHAYTHTHTLPKVGVPDKLKFILIVQNLLLFSYHNAVAG